VYAKSQNYLPSVVLDRHDEPQMSDRPLENLANYFQNLPTRIEERIGQPYTQYFKPTSLADIQQAQSQMVSKNREGLQVPAPPRAESEPIAPARPAEVNFIEQVAIPSLDVQIEIEEEIYIEDEPKENKQNRSLQDNISDSIQNPSRRSPPSSQALHEVDLLQLNDAAHSRQSNIPESAPFTAENVEKNTLLQGTDEMKHPEEKDASEISNRGSSDYQDFPPDPKDLAQPTIQKQESVGQQVSTAANDEMVM
jgi:hypothetical protein